ncbi:MAG: peptidase M, neutral zinc metallopeptidase site [Nostocales cyanobacterium]|nr:MAG: peptidase M, neutral zinc metallopeptidase site [Nostocales cyanobacterium]TAF15086.1 MAG: peptidase M, neutral zinc metallopeptidase site [Nostocales cyanobacterium]
MNIDSLKTASHKSQQLAQQRKFREAVKIAETALNQWQEKSNLWQKLVGKFLIANLLESLQKQLGEWRSQVTQADKLINQAESILKNDTGDPLNITSLTSAIAIYHLASQVIFEPQISELIHKYQQEVSKRQKFQLLVRQAKTQADNRFFKSAISLYKEAGYIYNNEFIKQAISDIQGQVYQEENYHSALEKASHAESEGKLKVALSILEEALISFPRSDGFDLQRKLKLRIQGREIFAHGLVAEKKGDFLTAKSHYEQAKSLISNSTDCQLRLGILAIKTQDWDNAIFYLQNLPGQQAGYLRGFVFAHQGNLQAAYQEWEKISHPLVVEQTQILNRISQQQHIVYLQQIEDLVAAADLPTAKNVSQEFLKKFAPHPLVETNLKKYIQPSLEKLIWQSSNWDQITQHTQNSWLENPQIDTLHNWVVANYYCSQKNPEKLDTLIISLSTALANLTVDNSLQNLPWLGDEKVDFLALSLNLKRPLEAAIDQIKNYDLEVYFNLRDYYRRESVALKFMGEPAHLGKQVNNLFITPGCYEYFSQHWQSLLVDNIPAGDLTLSSLYTPWGLAVAACLEGDIQRAINIKPQNQPSNKTEKFADQLLKYYEGCYQLQQQRWRLAMTPLQSVREEIKYHQDWQQEIEKLFNLQRQVIVEFEENLQFANFCYEILPKSISVKSYYTEYKAEEVRQKIVNDKISLNQALAELQELQIIDRDNTIVLDMIDNVELSQEIKEINRLFQVEQYEAMLKKAKFSKRERVRYIVAEFFLNMIIKGIQQNRLHDQELILQLGVWAYEICPHEPAFQEIYRSLKLC